MSLPKSIPEDEIEGYPCDCGGSITMYNRVWYCDNCDFEKKDVNGGSK
ncbi:MAG: hypothetical protein [Podoviridae sp. cty5g4]|nr:MAG: hypothetical protein [Podoviridae sp. cty5g4]